MRRIMTRALKEEIGELGKEHGVALIAWGSQLYRQGYIKGVIAGAIMTGCGYALSKRIPRKNVQAETSNDEQQNINKEES